MIPNSMPLPKNVQAMQMTAAHLSAPPSLIEVQQMFNRGYQTNLVKVPSLMELNARASSPAGVRVAPPSMPPMAVARAVPMRPEAVQPKVVQVVTAVDANKKDSGLAPQPGVTCANCKTQKTPLWRNGPLGPKTLCNACGVRYKLGKLPPPGGWPPGHVPPPPPPRKRPAHSQLHGDTKKPKHLKENDFESSSKKQRRKGLKLAPSDDYIRTHFGANAVLTDYDGAVLLMVLAGLYDR